MSGTALFLVVGFLVVLGAQNIYSQSAEEPSTTCWFLHKYGYDCEKHSVTTSDGYILNMFRVLCPNNKVNTTSTRPVALLMHGMPCSSTIWVISPETGLGMSMCDSGYDVWLGNVRGTQYSEKHVTLPTDGPDFWKFSFTEMGMKDLPAMIKYTLDHTGQKNLHFVGHSQGASTYFIYAATDPTSAASSISSAHLLAPVAYVEHTQSPAFVIGAPQIGKADPTSDVSEVKADLVPLISQVLGKQFCENSDPAKGICQELFDTVFGTSNLVNKTIYADVLSTLPDGASLRNVKHSLQEKVSGKFCDFDFGEELNMKKYGTAQPTEFPLEAITVPTYMYYSDNDDLVNLQDYQKIVDRLNSNAKKTTRLYKGYAHMDFIMANNVKEDLHKIILQDMQANI